MKQDGIFAKDEVVNICTERIATCAIKIINETKQTIKCTIVVRKLHMQKPFLCIF